MKNKSDNTNGQPKGKSATRSAVHLATGNRNKHLLAAERRRIDKANGRLNKQNPVSPQKMNPINKSDTQAKNAGKYGRELHWMQMADTKLSQLSWFLMEVGQLRMQAEVNAVQIILNGIQVRLAKLQ